MFYELLTKSYILNIAYKTNDLIQLTQNETLALNVFFNNTLVLGNGMCMDYLYPHEGAPIAANECDWAKPFYLAQGVLSVEHFNVSAIGNNLYLASNSSIWFDKQNQFIRNGQFIDHSLNITSNPDNAISFSYVNEQFKLDGTDMCIDENKINNCADSTMWYRWIDRFRSSKHLNLCFTLNQVASAEMCHYEDYVPQKIDIEAPVHRFGKKIKVGDSYFGWKDLNLLDKPFILYASNEEHALEFIVDSQHVRLAYDPTYTMTYGQFSGNEFTIMYSSENTPAWAFEYPQMRTYGQCINIATDGHLEAKVCDMSYNQTVWIEGEDIPTNGPMVIQSMRTRNVLGKNGKTAFSLINNSLTLLETEYCLDATATFSKDCSPAWIRTGLRYRLLKDETKCLADSGIEPCLHDYYTNTNNQRWYSTLQPTIEDQVFITYDGQFVKDDFTGTLDYGQAMRVTYKDYKFYTDKNNLCISYGTDIELAGCDVAFKWYEDNEGFISSAPVWCGANGCQTYHLTFTDKLRLQIDRIGDMSKHITLTNNALRSNFPDSFTIMFINTKMFLNTNIDISWGKRVTYDGNLLKSYWLSTCLTLNNLELVFGDCATAEKWIVAEPYIFLQRDPTFCINAAMQVQKYTVDDPNQEIELVYPFKPVEPKGFLLKNNKGFIGQLSSNSEYHDAITFTYENQKLRMGTQCLSVKNLVSNEPLIATNCDQAEEWVIVQPYVMLRKNSQLCLDAAATNGSPGIYLCSATDVNQRYSMVDIGTVINSPTSIGYNNLFWSTEHNLLHDRIILSDSNPLQVLFEDNLLKVGDYCITVESNLAGHIDEGNPLFLEECSKSIIWSRLGFRFAANYLFITNTNTNGLVMSVYGDNQLWYSDHLLEDESFFMTNTIGEYATKDFGFTQNKELAISFIYRDNYLLTYNDLCLNYVDGAIKLTSCSDANVWYKTGNKWRLRDSHCMDLYNSAGERSVLPDCFIPTPHTEWGRLTTDDEIYHTLYNFIDRDNESPWYSNVLYLNGHIIYFVDMLACIGTGTCLSYDWVRTGVIWTNGGRTVPSTLGSWFVPV